jgi:hypothetical protein
MKYFKTNLLVIAVLFTISFHVNAQENDDEIEGSVIQTLTPSKLIGKGQYDIKWFNNLYTETESTFASGTQPRQTFFTSTLEFYTGVGNNRRWNVGAIIEARSNVIAGRDALDVFSFDGEFGTARSGITAIAPSVKFVPFEKVSNFSIQSSLFIPTIDNESEDFTTVNGNNGVFLSQKGFRLQNRFFYDYTFPSKDWQIFAELNSEFSFGDENESFANNSLNLIPGVFLSYFPSSKFTVFGLAQHAQRIDLGNDFAQDFTAMGAGVKYQLTDKLNLETLYTNFVRGNNTGLGETFNLGLRLVL